MFALCEARLGKPGPPANRFGEGKEGDSEASGGWRERQAGLAAAFEVAQERLVEYFKVRDPFPIFCVSVFFWFVLFFPCYFVILLFSSTVHFFFVFCVALCVL